MAKGQRSGTGTPRGEKFQNLPPFRQKSEAEAAIDRALATVETAGREPDAWEARFLWMAVNAMQTRKYVFAVWFAGLVAIGPSERAEAQKGINTSQGSAGEPTLAALRASLDQVRRKGGKAPA